jgi:predicted HD superfamily hydrolase involved in NAD metabolism
MKTARDLPKAAEYADGLAARLPKKQVRHVLSVADWAVEIAQRLGVDWEAVAVAAYLHDWHKKTPPEELLRLAHAYGVPVTEVFAQKPKLLHGPVAAETARRELGINDAGILDAIAWHTTGKPGLGPVGLVLYIADFSEPLRAHPESDEARAIFEEEGALAALRYIALAKLEHAAEKPPVDPNTAAFDAWLHEDEAAASIRALAP